MRNRKDVLETVLTQYSAVARSNLTNDSAGVRSVAEAFGYTPDELASLPPQANMGLSCGNPTALAGLRKGEVVVDLGCGGGLDVLLAAKQVGPNGSAIGIDMTSEMLDRARAGAAQVGATNVEFFQAQIDQLPLPDSSVDCVISNCVINLAPDKPAVFREMLRVLKPGGRVAISDIALRQTLPDWVASSMQAYVGCISGAVLIADYQRLLEEAGFATVVVSETGADLNAYAQASSGSCCSTNGSAGALTTDLTDPLPQLHEGLAQVLANFDANAYAASVRVHAVKTLGQTLNISQTKVAPRRTIQVFDKPMCCSTGVCGPQIDPVLPRFSADLDWLKSQGHDVERYNLAQQPTAFIQNSEVHQLLSTQGTDCLPLIMVDGHIVSRRNYPSREMLQKWTQASAPSEATLEIVTGTESCTAGSNCC